MKTKHLSILFIVLSQLIFGQKKTENLKSAQEFFTVTSDSTKLFTKISGNGDLCIYVHGGPGMWSDSFENLKGKNLESRLKMVYYDQRGSGRSFAATNNDYSVNRMVEDIEDVRKKTGFAESLFNVTFIRWNYRHELRGKIWPEFERFNFGEFHTLS